MHLRRAAAAAAAVVISLSLFLLPSTTDGHNITQILADHPDFSTFNHYLTVTSLAPEINRRNTITVCAVNNTAMDALLSKNLSAGTVKNVLSLHVLLDYFDAKKLHQITDGTATIATLFQTTGEAPGSTGFVNITDLKGGKVGFTPQGEDGAGTATLVKPLQATPYNISVIQISAVLTSPEAQAPAPAQTEMNLTAALLSSGRCKVFAETLLANRPAEETFENNVVSGLTVFCPGNDAMKKFLPEFRNLSAEGKQNLLEYHGMPIHQSLSELKANNGETSTLATDGADKYEFTVQNNGRDVTIKTPLVTAAIVNTLVDEQPLAIYELDKVLLPKELFKSALAPTPAPAPDAETPNPSTTHKSPPAPPSDSPADAPAPDSAEHAADDNGAVRFNGGGFIAVCLSLWFVILQL